MATQKPCQQPMISPMAYDAADETDQRADGQVDVPSDDDHDHADSQNHHIGVLLDETRQVIGRQQQTTGNDLEENDDRDQRRENPVLTQITPEIGPGAAHLATAFALPSSPPRPPGTPGSSGPAGIAEFSIVISFMRFS